MKKIVHNVKYIQRLQLQNRIFWVLIFFLGVYGLLLPFRTKIISPCPDSGCSYKTVYVVENLTIQEQVIIAGYRMFGLSHLEALKNIVFHESSFNPYAINKTSGAGGLFQALPFSKTGCKLTEISCQINWGLHYIAERYQNPTNAWEFWKAHGYY